MHNLLRFGEYEPRVAPDAFVAPDAVLIGDVVVEGGANIHPGAVLRGDYNRIVVGSGSAVHDRCVIHSNGTQPTLIGANVTLGPCSILEACTIEDGATLGTGSIALHRSKVGKETILAAGTVVRADQEIPPKVLAAGTPAKIEKPIEEGAAEQATSPEHRSLRVEYIQEFMAKEAGADDA